MMVVPDQQWESLGQVPPKDLTSARLELHAAIQCVASVSASYLPRAADDSQVSTGWLGAEGALVGSPKTIGVGMAPGDTSYPEPYWYVTPWPYPATDRGMPDLAAGGRWHVEGWFGAVLTAADTIAPREPEKQAARVAVFLRGAAHANRTLLD